MFEASRLQWRKLLSFIHKEHGKPAKDKTHREHLPHSRWNQLPRIFFGTGWEDAHANDPTDTPQYILKMTPLKPKNQLIASTTFPSVFNVSVSIMQRLPHLKKMKRLRFLPFTSTSGWLFNPLRATGSGGVQLESGGWLFKPGLFRLVLSPLKLSLIISYAYIYI